MHKLFVGTSSWTFPDWQGNFYPDDLPKGDQLRYYATQFNSVEVNTSFYGLPAASTLLQWVESVPEGFRFALKAPRLITHERRLVDCAGESLAFLDVLRSLGESAAPGFLQFPQSFSRAKEGRVLADYLKWLGQQREGLAVGVEVRSGDLMTGAFMRYLGEQGLAYVLVERIETPDLFETWLKLLEAGSVPGYLFLRIIGDDQEKPPNFRSVQRPQDAALERWAGRIAGLLAQGIPCYVFVHNPFEGHSPATVRRLRQAIHPRHPLPPWQPDMVPPVEEEEEGDGSDGQLSLF